MFLTLSVQSDSAPFWHLFDARVLKLNGELPQFPPIVYKGAFNPRGPQTKVWEDRQKTLIPKRRLPLFLGIVKNDLNRKGFSFL